MKILVDSYEADEVVPNKNTLLKFCYKIGQY